MTDDTFYYITNTLIIERDDILGTDYDHEIEEGRIAIKVTLKIPKALFEPVPITIEIPESYLQPESIQTDVTEIEVPVTVNNKEENIKVTQEVTPAHAKGLLAILRTKIFGK